MALTITESTTLSGKSVINGQEVATFSVSLSLHTVSSISVYNNNPSMVEANKVEFRKDRDAFQDAADSKQDELDKKADTESEPTASTPTTN
ncbi:hypothetical protein ABVF11_02385 [Pediococcus argentinicus]|uniref:hypothetical protein n=1 Tax=Pediococcus argentinicus TaxID=480391 RepID=UPI0033905C26